jgi:hypothetical protein
MRHLDICNNETHEHWSKGTTKHERIKKQNKKNKGVAKGTMKKGKEKNSSERNEQQSKEKRNKEIMK